jgi:glycosyltransferase involved in cell wall biosynthesis
MSVQALRLPTPPRKFPIPIVHIELASIEAQADWQPAEASLVILTKDGLPVGQVYCEPNGFDRSTFLPASPATKGNPATPPATVGVVICTRDRPDELERCLASLPAQSRRPDEIVVVDNASKDQRTRDVALKAGVTYVREDRPGLDFARNTGARTVKSEIVAYTDDDVVLHPQWLENLAGAFDAPDIVAATGLVLPGSLETEAQYIFETEWGFGRGYQVRIFDETYYDRTRKWGSPVWEVGAGASMAFRKTIFDRIGYFDERLDVGQAGCSGDSEYWYRILHFGGKCRYQPTAVAYHFHRTTLEGLERQLRAYMSGHTAALLVQYERTGEKGNLRHLILSLPKHYLRKIAKRIVRGRTYDNFFLRSEISGCIDGVLFYLKRRSGWQA